MHSYLSWSSSESPLPGLRRRRTDESCAQLPLLVLFRVSSSGPETKEGRLSVRLPCKTLRVLGWLLVIRSTIYSMMVALRMLMRHSDVHLQSADAIVGEDLPLLNDIVGKQRASLPSRSL